MSPPLPCPFISSPQFQLVLKYNRLSFLPFSQFDKLKNEVEIRLRGLNIYKKVDAKKLGRASAASHPHDLLIYL